MYGSIQEQQEDVPCLNRKSEREKKAFYKTFLSKELRIWAHSEWCAYTALGDFWSWWQPDIAHRVQSCVDLSRFGIPAWSTHCCYCTPKIPLCVSVVVWISLPKLMEKFNCHCDGIKRWGPSWMDHDIIMIACSWWKDKSSSSLYLVHLLALPPLVMGYCGINALPRCRCYALEFSILQNHEPNKLLLFINDPDSSILLQHWKTD